MIDPEQRRAPQRSICFCGKILVGCTICPSCAETMTAALLSAARTRWIESMPSATALEAPERETEPVAV
jgi:hypothetical protein